MDGAAAPARIFSPAAERLGPHVPTVVGCLPPAPGGAEDAERGFDRVPASAAGPNLAGLDLTGTDLAGSELAGAGQIV
jgi:hypothetical protein